MEEVAPEVFEVWTSQKQHCSVNQWEGMDLDLAKANGPFKLSNMAMRDSNNCLGIGLAGLGITISHDGCGRQNTAVRLQHEIRGLPGRILAQMTYGCEVSGSASQWSWNGAVPSSELSEISVGSGLHCAVVATLASCNALF